MTNQKALEQFKKWEESGWSKSETPNTAALIYAAKALEKQALKPPELKVHPDYPSLGKMYYCECGVLFCGWGNPKEETNYCGNCGQKLKGDE